MKWGGGGGPEGGGGLVVVQKYMGSMVFGGGALGIHNTIHNTTQTCHVYRGGPAGH